jgi:hypothetical protein
VAWSGLACALTAPVAMTANAMVRAPTKVFMLFAEKAEVVLAVRGE